MEKPRKRYIQQFKQYPDVVSVLTFREMLGGIGDSFARKLIHEGLVKAIFIKPHYGAAGYYEYGFCISEKPRSRCGRDHADPSGSWLGAPDRQSGFSGAQKYGGGAWL